MLRNALRLLTRAALVVALAFPAAHAQRLPAPPTPTIRVEEPPREVPPARPRIPAPIEDTTTPAAPEPYTRLQGAYLRRTIQFDQDKARTLVSMQEHVQWVSGDEATARRELAANGFTLHGGGFIDTEADGIAGIATTGRLRAYVAHRGSDLVVVFRGTSGSNWRETGGNMVISDFNIRKRNPGFIRNAPYLVRQDDPRREARVHAGFARAYERLRPAVIEAVEAHPGKDVYVFGHSLGGALATLCALDLAGDRTRGIRSLTHISSGTPRVGDGTFRSLFESLVPNNLRVTVGHDPIPLIPVGVPARRERRAHRHYRHAGRLLPLSLGGRALPAGEIVSQLHGARFAHHDNQVYLEAARAYAARPNGYPNVTALGNAERAAAEANARAVLEAIPSIF